MRSRALILASLVALAAVILVIGVAVAGAGQSDPLPDITAPDLLAKMAQADGRHRRQRRHRVAQRPLRRPSAASGMAHLPAQSPLTSDGSGRIWVSDAGARVESQGSGGDQVVVVNKAERTAWVYDYAQNTVKKVVVTGTAPAETASPAPSATMLTPETITLYLQQVARFATVEVAGQTKVAGRDAYQLRMTPVATDTALGYVQAAVDGETMLPLQLEVYAKGGTAPVLKFGFTTVSYDSIDPSTFTFTPPAGAKVTAKTVDGDALRAKAEKMQQSHAGKAEPTKAQKDAAAAGCPGRAAHARPGRQAGPVRARVGARLHRPAVPVGLRAEPGRPAHRRPARRSWRCWAPPPAWTSGAATTGSHSATRRLAPRRARAASCSTARAWARSPWRRPQTTPDLAKQLKQAAAGLPDPRHDHGARRKAAEVGTPLGGIIVWQQGGTTLVAGGMVPMSDLEAFASSVR